MRRELRKETWTIFNKCANRWDWDFFSLYIKLSCELDSYHWGGRFLFWFDDDAGIESFQRLRWMRRATQRLILKQWTRARGWDFAAVFAAGGDRRDRSLYRSGGHGVASANDLDPLLTTPAIEKNKSWFIAMAFGICLQMHHFVRFPLGCALHTNKHCYTSYRNAKHMWYLIKIQINFMNFPQVHKTFAFAVIYQICCHFFICFCFMCFFLFGTSRSMFTHEHCSISALTHQWKLVMRVQCHELTALYIPAENMVQHQHVCTPQHVHYM